MVTNKEITTLQNGAVANGLVLEITTLVDGQQVGGRPEQQVLVQGIIGSPEGRAIGSPGDIKIRQDTPELWQKITGVRTRTGWIRLHSGGSPTMESTYVTSGGADPTIQLTPALGPLSINGAGGLANILELRRATGVAAFVVAETGDVTAIGDLSMNSASPSSSFGNALGSPLVSLQKSAVGTSTIQYRITTVGNTSGDKRTQHNATEGLVVENYNGASWDTLTTYTTTVTQNVATNFDFAVTMDSTLAVTGAITGASMSVSGNLVGTGAASEMRLGDATASPAAFLQKGAAGTAYVYLRVTTSGFTSTDKRMGMDASERITWENYNGASWDVVLQATAATLTTLLPFHSGAQTVTGAINATGTIRAGDATGNVSMVLQKGAANTSDLMARVTTSGNTSGDKRLLQNTSESWIFQNYNGASWDDLATYTTVVTHNVATNFDAAVTMDTTLSVTGDADADSFTATGSGVAFFSSTGGMTISGDAVVGNATTHANLFVQKGAASNGTIEFRQTTSGNTAGDQRIWHTTVENFETQRYNGATWDNIMRWTSTVRTYIAAQFDITANFDGAVTMTSDLGVDGDVEVGDASGGANLSIQKAGGSTGNLVYRVTTSGNTSGDKRVQHTASEGLVVENYNGASWDTLATFSTFSQFETAINIEDALNVRGTSGLINVGVATGNANLQHQKSAGGTSTTLYRVTTSGNTSGDKRSQHTGTETFVIENYNGASWDTLTTYTTIVTQNVATNFDDAVTMDTTLGVTGLMSLGANLDMDSASPAAILGDATGSPLILIFKGAASTSQQFWRTSNSGATTGDKAFAHNPSEGLEVRNYNGASWDTLATYTTNTTFNSGVGGPTRVNAAGAACAITPTDWFVDVSSDGGGPIVISHTMTAGQSVRIGMSAFVTDAYTMAVVGGTLTLNAVGEAATIMYDGTNVWVTALGTATLV